MPHAWTVADLAERVGLSQRRFIQVFTEEVGLTPKLFGRILRFQEVLAPDRCRETGQMGEPRRRLRLLRPGAFHPRLPRFSGLNPTAYLGLRTDHINHVPLVE